jgi:sulfate permease, SulP family
MHRISPVTAELGGYGGEKLKHDLAAGLTVSALALPSGIAYAELAGVPPVAGLYALLLPLVIYALLGSSRQLVIGPEGAIAALVATAVLPVVGGDPERYASLASLLALLVGAVFLLARIIRLGWIADYFSRAVLTGYIHGVAVVLIIAQLGKIFGLEIDAEKPIDQLAEFAREITESSATTIAVGMASLAALLALRWLAPKVPGALLVLVLSIIASAALDLEAHGVATVGQIPSGLPSPSIPNAPLSDVLALLPAALGIFFVGFADQILTARSFAGRHGQHVQADQELVAMGLANASAGITQSFPIGASGSRTAVSDQTGVRTQVAGLVSAAAITLILLFFTEPIHFLPFATLGAVIVAAAIGLVEPRAWEALSRAGRAEVLIAAITAVGVVLVGVLQALVIAVALSLLDVVRRSATPHDAVLGWVERLGRYADVRLHKSARITPGVLIYRLDDRLFFANASYVRGRIREAIAGAPALVRWFVFDAEALSHIDATGIHALKELAGSLRDDGVTLSVARLKDPMQRAFREAGLLDIIGPRHIYPTVRAAVDATDTERKDA